MVATQVRPRSITSNIRRARRQAFPAHQGETLRSPYQESVARCVTTVMALELWNGSPLSIARPHQKCNKSDGLGATLRLKRGGRYLVVG